jgi:hypothetical protein
MLDCRPGVIENIWPESYNVLETLSAGTGDVVLSFADTVTNFGIVGLIIGFFLFAFGRIADGFEVVVVSLFNYKELVKIEGQTNLFMSRNILLAFSLLVLSFIFANSDISHYLGKHKYPVGITFALSLALFMGYFMARRIAFYVLNWVNRCNFFKHISRIYYTHLTLAAIFSIVGLVLYMLLPNMGSALLKYYLFPTLAVVFTVYFLRCYKIIISNGFSNFFWILYICTLEILPLVVLGHVILS